MESPATDWSLEFFSEALVLGLTDVVVSPGSRSQSLALVAEALSRQEGCPLRVHVAIDERTAGFLALGISAHSRAPVILVCTSGSAPGHYLPALLEAKHSGVSLIALTADRPEELRGTGANQTTDQVGLFGTAVDRVVDVDAPGSPDNHSGRDVARMVFHFASEGAPAGRPGTVHCNVAFREPLSRPLEPRQLEVAARARPQPPVGELAPSRVREIQPEQGTMVIAGHGAGPEAEAVARALGAPLIAEVHSGAHFGPNLVVSYRELLSEDKWQSTLRRIITVGRPTLSRQVQALLTRGDIEQIVWQRGEVEPANPSGSAEVVDEVRVAQVVDAESSSAWVGPWVQASRSILEDKARELDPPSPDLDLASADDMASRSRFAQSELGVFRRPLTRRDIALGVWESTWPHDFLVLGSSRMIRELDGVAPGKNIPVWSNRGLSGIDGTIATARGIALARSRAAASGITRALMGDLAFVHDAGSLLLDQGEAEATYLQLVIVRDGGGSLFDLLEAAQTAERESFDRVMFTPVSVDIEALAQAYSWTYQRVTYFGELPEALGNTSPHHIIECVVERSAT